MRLDFLNPVFAPGKNTTVRRGAKFVEWDELFLHRTGAPGPVATGHIREVHTMRRESVTSQDLVNEHDPACRTLRGLWKTMEKDYGHPFLATDIVTIIDFWVDPL